MLFLDEFEGEISEENYIGGFGYLDNTLEKIIEIISGVSIDKSYDFEVEVANTEREKALNFKFKKDKKIILIDISKRLAN